MFNKEWQTRSCTSCKMEGKQVDKQNTITKKPSCRWQTRATRKHAKNCSNSTFLTLSLTILAYLYSFSCCCVRNLRNPEKFSENSNLQNSRSSKVINLGVNGKPICHFLLVIIVTLAVSAIVFEIFRLKDRKLLILPNPPLFYAP